MKMNQATPLQQLGFSMIEIMVTMVIIALALLGSAGLQAYSMKTNMGGQYRNQAAFFVSDIIERMEANKVYAASTVVGYSTALTTTVNCEATAASAVVACSPATLAAYDVKRWKDAISAVLPQGTGTVTQSVTGNPSTYTVTVNWVDRKTNASYSVASAAAATEGFSITTSRTIGN